MDRDIKTETHGWIGEPPTPRYVWLCCLVWFAAGALLGVWAALGFPMGVAL